MNKFVTCLIAFYFIFGNVLYSAIASYANFAYTDEITVLLLFCAAFFPRKQGLSIRVLRNMLLVTGIFVFYLLYSLKIHSNTRTAILTDFLIQIKPYIAFYCTLLIAPNLIGEKQFLKFIVLCSVPVLLVDALLSPGGEYFRILGHPTCYSSCAVIVALVYLYSKRELMSGNRMMFCMLLSICLFSMRVKSLAFWGVTIFLLVFIPHFRLKMSFKNGLLYCMMFGIVLALSFQKIHRYVDAGYDPNQLAARTALYQGAIVLLKKHVPFGSGYASYATFASGAYYSKTYYELELSHVHGLTPGNPAFAADTYFPALAEFGVAGICLFACFWIGILLKANRYRKPFGHNINLNYILVLLIVLFLMIQSVAASTLTHNTGVFMMILLALCLTDLKREAESLSENRPSMSGMSRRTQRSKRRVQR